MISLQSSVFVRGCSALSAPKCSRATTVSSNSTSTNASHLALCTEILLCGGSLTVSRVCVTGLDRQGSSGSGGADIEQPYSLSRIDPGSNSRSTMTNARPDQNGRASPSATHHEEGGAIASELACPCCAVPWRELGLEADDALYHRTGEAAEEQQRAAHVEACLFAAQQDSVDSGLDSSRNKMAVADEDEGGSAFALHGTAEDEESEMKGRQVAAHGRSTKDEGGGGDAAHETSVNSTPGERSSPFLPPCHRSRRHAETFFPLTHF